MCRVEERKHFAAKSTIESINDIFNPADRLAAQLDEIKYTLIRLVNDRGIGGSPQQPDLPTDM